MRARSVARSLVPPVLTDAVARARQRNSSPEWEVAPSWPDLGAELGWEHPAIAETARSRFTRFQRSVAAPEPLGRSNEADATSDPSYAVHNTYLSFAYVLARASVGRPGLSILDWGGGLGEYLELARALFPELAIEYVCKDQPAMVAAGAQVNPRARFVSELDVEVVDQFDLVVASSSMHYSQDWQRVFGLLASTARRWLYVTRQPIVLTHPSYVLVQHAHRHGYPTSYPGWVLNRSELLQEASMQGAHLEREFLIDERPVVPGADEQPEYRGFLFDLTGAA